MNLGNLGALDSTLLWGVGLLCLVLITVTLLRRWQFRRLATRDHSRDDQAHVRQERELHQALTELASQLDGVSRRIEGQTAEQLAKLSAALAAADERIERLGGGPPSSASVSTAARHEPSPSEADPRIALGARLENGIRQRVYDLADRGQRPGTIAEALHVPVGEVELLLNVRKFAQRGEVTTRT